MSEDDPVVVVFRKWKTDHNVLALFPTLPATNEPDSYCLSYEHVGQHCAADYRHCIDQTTPATPEEYASLKRELESDPYNYKLIVRRRYTQRRSR